MNLPSIASIQEKTKTNQHFPLIVPSSNRSSQGKNFNSSTISSSITSSNGFTKMALSQNGLQSRTTHNSIINNRLQLSNHRMKNQETTPRSSKVKCVYCDNDFPSKLSLHHHHNQLHPGLPEIVDQSSVPHNEPFMDSIQSDSRIKMSSQHALNMVMKREPNE